MQEVNFLQDLHTSTKRDYFARMNAEKPECMRVAKKFGKDYWDGDRKYGYGKYSYDKRWIPVAEKMVTHFGLDKKKRILDIGCGKGFLLHDIHEICKSIACYGIDISEYAINRSQHLMPQLYIADARDIPYDDNHFDFAYSLNTFHNMNYRGLKQALSEMIRVGGKNGYICVESYETEEQMTALECWALTALSIYSKDDWLNIFSDNGFEGSYEFVTFD